MLIKLKTCESFKVNLVQLIKPQRGALTIYYKDVKKVQFQNAALVSLHPETLF